jgi:hypothetical protein
MPLRRGCSRQIESDRWAAQDWQVAMLPVHRWESVLMPAMPLDFDNGDRFRDRYTKACNNVRAMRISERGWRFGSILEISHR